MGVKGLVSILLKHLIIVCGYFSSNSTKFKTKASRSDDKCSRTGGSRSGRGRNFQVRD